TQEEAQPSFEVPRVTHGLEARVVLRSLALEVVRQIQHRLAQHTALAKQERDKQSADAAVAVEERMDCFELRMRETDLHEQRYVVPLVQKSLERAERGWNLTRRRRYESGFGERASAGANPVLAASQLAWGQPRAAHVVQQLTVNLADQANGHRQFCQAREPVLHCSDVVDDLRDILGAVVVDEMGFGSKQILERALRTLDLTRQYRFLADIHIHEEVGIRQRLDRAVQPAKRAVGLGQEPLQLAGYHDGRGWRQRGRQKGPIPCRLLTVSACAQRCVHHGALL